MSVILNYFTSLYPELTSSCVCVFVDARMMERGGGGERDARLSVNPG